MRLRRVLRRIVPTRIVGIWTPATRAFDLTLPARIESDGPTSLRIEAPWSTYIPRLLERDGVAGYEPESLAALLACIEVLPPAPVFDVGANVGAFSLVAAALTGAEVVGFEPTPELARTFEHLARLNRLDRVIVERLALGATDGEATLYLSDRTDSSNSLNATFRPSHATVQVPLERLDTYVDRTGRRPRLLKIDTESTEPDVLAGAASYLQTDRPWIVCEVLAGRTEADLMAILGPLGYRFHHLREDGPSEPLETIAGDPTYRLLDWLFVPEDLPVDLGNRVRRWFGALSGTPVRRRA